MKLLVDMNLSPEWVGLFRQEGHDARHWSEIGPPTASDRTILAWAEQEQFLIFTHDLDFGDLLAASGRSTPSVILLRSQSVQVEAVGQHVITQIQAFATELSQGAVLVIDTLASRVRLLPIR